MTPYQQGYACYWKYGDNWSFNPDLNPYKPWTWQSREWFEGWDDAEEDDLFPWFVF